MNKCLVTTLKAQTNNEALSKYNVLTIKIKASDSPTMDTQWFGIGSSINGSISVYSSNVGLYKSGISGELYPYPINITANNKLESHFENKDGIIEVTNKYNLNAIQMGYNATVRMKEIYGIPATIEWLDLKNIEENEIDATRLSNAINRSEINNFVIPTVTVINKLSKNIVREFKAISSITTDFCSLFDNLGLDDITNNVSIIYITFTGLNGLNAGNLSSLAKLTNLTGIKFEDYKQNKGDIMDFITPWIAAGRTSGKIQVEWLLGQKNITLNGQRITYPEGVSQSKAYLNWTSDGTVTFTAS